MKRQILNILCCPKCKQALTLMEKEVVKDEVIDGVLDCSSCQSSFKIMNGVPRMIVDLGGRRELAESWGFQWDKTTEKKFEIDTLYGKTKEEELNDFFHFLDITPDDLKGKLILDAGCGNGRLTKALGKYGAEVFGIEIASSIEKLYEYCRPYKNVNIVQADILNLPFKKATFDYVWGKLVICYVQETEYAFKNLSKLVKSYGKLFIAVPDKTNLPFTVKLRDFLKVSHKIPRKSLFYLSWCLAPSLSLAKRVLKKRRTSLRTNAFFLFNAMQPEFFTRHTEEEVIGWFRKGNFCDIICINGAQHGIYEHGIYTRGTKK